MTGLLEIDPAIRALDARLRTLSPAKDRARIELVVQRLPGEDRRTPSAVILDPEEGVVGDKWGLKATRNPQCQVTLMRWDVATLFGPEPALFGDNLFAALDTSRANLCAGTILRVGTARCEVTPKPHTGCSKFQRRAGAAALAITRRPEWVDHQLRGLHLRVLDRGTVNVGDAIVVLSRP
jgi:MOSC domain-containing protein YiiM